VATRVTTTKVATLSKVVTLSRVATAEINSRTKVTASLLMISSAEKVITTANITTRRASTSTASTSKASTSTVSHSTRVVQAKNTTGGNKDKTMAQDPNKAQEVLRRVTEDLEVPSLVA